MHTSPKPLAPCDLISFAGRAPRYTSYPPATELAGTFGPDDARTELERMRAAEPDEPISLYCHIPFCSRLCWYCGCNVTVTRDRSRGSRYVDTLLAELELMAKSVGRRPILDVSWGGGSPNFLSPEDMAKLATGIGRYFDLPPDAMLGIELDPRDSNHGHLAALSELGFTRMSVGVQDFALPVQKAINRHQSAEQTGDLIADARRLGFKQVNVDLVYGLPLQTTESLGNTIEEVLDMDPEQVAIFGYAHLPQRLPHQKLVERAGAVPGPEARAELLFVALERFDRAGYIRIGIDHFARPDSPLAHAALEGRLHRNFQGYVPYRTAALLGVGATAISDSGGAYWQNSTDVGKWATLVEEGHLPVHRGVGLSDDDRLRRWVITRLMCDLEIDLAEVGERFSIDAPSYFERELDELGSGDYTKLVEVDRSTGWIGATALGCNLIRNVCLVFDRYSATRAPGGFSSTI
jgi:oxygen-independent coproporphyrinogen-3 oxidase